jgi:hypothetical protein
MREPLSFFRPTVCISPKFMISNSVLQGAAHGDFYWAICLHHRWHFPPLSQPPQLPCELLELTPFPKPSL